jgi:hypothetical protein
MGKKVFQAIAILAAAAMLSGCFIRLVGTPGGIAGTQSGNYPDCQAGASCTDIPLIDANFNETFVAVPDAGYEFLYWKKSPYFLFGCNTDAEATINTAFFLGTFFEQFLSDPLVTFMSPVFRSTGAEIYYSTDFECNDINAGALGDGWLSFVNVFEADGETYVGGYSVDGGAPNGQQISALTRKQGGNDQADRQLAVFSNYDSDFNGIFQHAAGQQLEVNVFQEFTLAAASAGTYTFTFDAKLPSDAAVASPSKAIAFIKVIDPRNGYQPFGPVITNNTTTLSTEWDTRSLTINVTSEMAGMLLQFGFSNTSTSYNPTGVLYDNVQVSP